VRLHRLPSSKAQSKPQLTKPEKVPEYANKFRLSRNIFRRVARLQDVRNGASALMFVGATLWLSAPQHSGTFFDQTPVRDGEVQLLGCGEVPLEKAAAGTSYARGGTPFGSGRSCVVSNMLWGVET
jgi:hypothetical protein